MSAPDGPESSARGHPPRKKRPTPVGRFLDALWGIEGASYVVWLIAAAVYGVRWVFGPKSVPLAPWAAEGLLVLIVGGIVVAVATWVAVRLKLTPPSGDSGDQTPD